MKENDIHLFSFTFFVIFLFYIVFFTLKQYNFQKIHIKAVYPLVSRMWLSLALGALFGAGFFFLLRKISFLFPPVLLLFSVTGFAVLLFIFLTVHRRYMAKRYAEIEAAIHSSIFHRSSGNFDLGGGKIRNGNVYFCGAGIVCVSLDGKEPSLDEILVQDIFRIEYDSIHLYIHTRDSRQFRITLPDATRIIDILKERDWVE